VKAYGWRKRAVRYFAARDGAIRNRKSAAQYVAHCNSQALFSETRARNRLRVRITIDAIVRRLSTLAFGALSACADYAN